MWETFDSLVSFAITARYGWDNYEFYTYQSIPGGVKRLLSLKNKTRCWQYHLTQIYLAGQTWRLGMLQTKCVYIGDIVIRHGMCKRKHENIDMNQHAQSIKENSSWSISKEDKICQYRWIQPYCILSIDRNMILTDMNKSKCRAFTSGTIFLRYDNAFTRDKQMFLVTRNRRKQHYNM